MFSPRSTPRAQSLRTSARSKSKRKAPQKFRRLQFDQLEGRALLASLIADFDGDGYADKAVGVPGEDIGTIVDAGAVHVIYGSAFGLTARNDYWHQNRAGIPDLAETADQFGFAMAAGDFNDDGFADLAVGSPGESVGAVLGAGSVIIIYGSPTGLNAGPGAPQPAALLTQGGAGNGALGDLLDIAEQGDRFGSALATGNFNFNADSAVDLAIGVPGENNSAGAVNVVYGSATGLVAAGEQYIDQNSTGIEGGSDPTDQFGFVLVTGSFNEDDNDDLAIGIPGEASGAGSVSVIYSAGAVGLSAVAVGGIGADDQLWEQFTLVDNAEVNDRFGQALAAGDFNADGFADLAIGVPNEDLSSADNGAVNVIFGQLGGLNVAGNTLFTQNDSGEVNEANDRFGFSLAAGDFNSDGFVDLAIGIPFEDLGGVVNIGAVAVRYTTLPPQIWAQDSANIPGFAEAFDEFGAELTAGDFNGDGAADLAIGVPGDNLGFIDNSGSLNALYGNPSIGSGGLSATFVPAQIWDQLKLGQGTAEAIDRFGGRPVTPASFVTLAAAPQTNSATSAAGEGEDEPALLPSAPAPTLPAPAPLPQTAAPPLSEVARTTATSEEDSPSREVETMRQWIIALLSSVRRGRRAV